jgi:molybdate transport system ATP-binding protein
MLNCQFDYQRNDSQNKDFKVSVNFQMQCQILGIVGASGSGKSTILKMLCGLLNPHHGKIQFEQNILFDSTQKINIPTYQRQIALVFQQAMLFPHLNVKQNLRYGEKLKSQQKQTFYFDDVVDLLELGKLIDRKAYQLSGGEAQRISIGRALLSSPKLLLLDEPLTGLDQQLREQVLPYLLRIKNDMQLPMIYVTHHLEELHALEAEILQLKQGCLSLVE